MAKLQLLFGNATANRVHSPTKKENARKCSQKSLIRHEAAGLLCILSEPSPCVCCLISLHHPVGNYWHSRSQLCGGIFVGRKCRRRNCMTGWPPEGTNRGLLPQPRPTQLRAHLA